MTLRSKLLTWMALPLVCAVIGGCGGGDAEAPPTGQPASPGTATPAAPDKTAPTMTIASDVSADVATGPVTFTFVFSEDVGISFDATDIVVTGGTPSAFTRVGGSQATVVVTPPANATGVITVSVAAGQYADIAGNLNTAATTASKNFNTVAPGPTAAAPTPPARTAMDVLSVYSDAYAQIAGVDPFPNWGQSTVVTEALVAGNKTRKYTNLNYQGTDWSGNPINVSAMSNLHIDFWTNDVTSVKVSIISAGKENTVTLTPALSSWNSVDIDLAQYTVPDKTAIIQLKIEGTPAGGTLYLDNIYFWKAAASGGGAGSCGTTAPTCAPSTTIPAGATTIYSDAAAAAGFNPFPNWGQPTQYSEATIASNKSLKYTGLTYEGIEFTAVDVSSKGKVHFDFWSPDLTSVKVSIISAGKENAVTKTLTTGTWNSIDIDLSEYAVPDLKAIIQIKLETVAGAGTLYVDNIYFWGGSAAVSCGTTAPTCAPSTTIPAGATTIYSDAAAAAGFNPFPNWGQPTQYSEATIASNKSLKYTGLTYEGIEFTAVDVSSKGKVHFDFWSPDLTAVKISIISAGKENAVTQALTAGSWNSVDIDLSSYTAPDLKAIIQIKLETVSGTGTLYVDNIYFWGTSATGGGGVFAGGVYASDYTGSLANATAKSTLGGSVGFFYDARLFTTKIYDAGDVVGTAQDPGGVHNFYYGFGKAASPQYTDAYFGGFVNAPGNTAADASAFAKVKLKFWGDAETWEKSNFTPQVEVVLQGPVNAACTNPSGRPEITKTVAGQKIGAGSDYIIPKTDFAMKANCGGAYTVNSVWSAVGSIVVQLAGTSLQYVNTAPSTPPSYPTFINIGPITFIN